MSEIVYGAQLVASVNSEIREKMLKLISAISEALQLMNLHDVLDIFMLNKFLLTP